MEQPPTRILLAEDDSSERRLITTFLTQQGYAVTEAKNGSDAVHLVNEINPDVIISDIHMPDFDGLELLDIITTEYEHIPFILISGLGTMNDVIFGLRHGAWDFLTKPLHPIDLLQHSITRVLERARLLRENRKKNEELEKLVRQRTSDLLSQNKAYEREIRERQFQERQARNALNEWRRTVDALPEMIAIIDSERRICRLNKPLLDLLNLNEKELLGTACFFCNEGHHCLQQKVIGDGVARKTELYLKDLQKYLELNIVPYSSPDGDFAGTIHVFRDITKLKEHAREKELLQAKLLHAQKLEAVGQLAAGIAHEINTPTQFVRSNVAFIEDAFTDIKNCLDRLGTVFTGNPAVMEIISKELHDADWDYLKEELPVAMTQSKEGLTRVSSIVHAMKEFSHPGSAESEQVDINHLIEVTLTVARNEWKYVADVDLKLDSGLPLVAGRSDELGQVLLNLLVNAAHAIQEKLGLTPDGEKGRIIIQTSFENDQVRIAITDDGDGIPAGIRAKVFDPFFTTKGVGKGTGQGLAIAYDVITNKHHGQLSFITETGEGTTFNIHLPVAEY